MHWNDLDHGEDPFWTRYWAHRAERERMMTREQTEAWRQEGIDRNVRQMLSELGRRHDRPQGM